MARDFSAAFYHSKEWQDVRLYILKRDRYVCRLCGKPAQEVHHKIHLSPENIWDVRITLNPSNLVSLCRDCHFEQHKRDKEEGKHRAKSVKANDCAEGFHFDENGQVVRDSLDPPH